MTSKLSLSSSHGIPVSLSVSGMRGGSLWSLGWADVNGGIA